MEEQNSNDELYPIAVLIDELKVRSASLFRIEGGGPHACMTTANELTASFETAR